MKHTGVCAQGLSCPIIREGDDLAAIVVDSVLSAVKTASNQYEICNKAVVGITESIVARSQGNYATVDDIANDVRAKFGPDATIFIVKPIYSRNRFAIILRGIARAAKKIVLIMPDVDEVGNVVKGHPFTNINYDEYYAEICEQEGASVSIFKDLSPVGKVDEDMNVIIGNLHGYDEARNSTKAAASIRSPTCFPTAANSASSVPTSPTRNASSCSPTSRKPRSWCLKSRSASSKPPARKFTSVSMATAASRIPSAASGNSPTPYPCRPTPIPKFSKVHRMS